MDKFTVTHELPVSSETFWKLTFDQELNQQMFEKELGFEEYRLLEQKETDGEIVRRVSAIPKLPLPDAVVEVIGKAFGYVEESRFDKKEKVLRYHGTPNTLPEQLKNGGEIRCVDLDGGRCRRVVDVYLEADIPLVGELIERTAEKNMRDAYERSATFMTDWAQARGLK